MQVFDDRFQAESGWIILTLHGSVLTALIFGIIDIYGLSSAFQHVSGTGARMSA
jgi:hypothetical protein